MSTPAADVALHPLVALCSKLLAQFLTGERGCPGREARRSGWVDVAILERWQDELAAQAAALGGVERDVDDVDCGQLDDTPATGGQLVEVPVDAAHRLSLAVLMPPHGHTITESLLAEIAGWARPAPTVVPRPTRRWLSDKIVTTRTRSGMPWRGLLQVVVTPEGDPVVAVRNALVVLPVAMAEVGGQAVSDA